MKTVEVITKLPFFIRGEGGRSHYILQTITENFWET